MNAYYLRLTPRRAKYTFSGRGVERVKRDAAFWQAVQGVIARGAAHWGKGVAGRALVTLSRESKPDQTLGSGVLAALS